MRIRSITYCALSIAAVLSYGQPLRLTLPHDLRLRTTNLTSTQAPADHLPEFRMRTADRKTLLDPSGPGSETRSSAPSVREEIESHRISSLAIRPQMRTGASAITPFDTVYVLLDSTRERRVYEYGPDHRMVTASTYTLQEGQWEPKEKFSYTYTPGGLLESRITLYLIDAVQVDERFLYDASGRQISMRSEYLDLQAGWMRAFARDTTAFDQNGNMTLAEYECWQDYQGYWGRRESWTITDSSIQSVTARRRQDHEVWIEETWIEEQRVTDMGTPPTRPTSSLRERWDGFGWVNTYLTQNQFDDKGRVIASSMSAWFDEHWNQDMRTAVVYGAFPDAWMKSARYWNGAEWTANWRSESVCDDQGRQVLLRSQTLGGDGWHTDYTGTSTYFPDGGILKSDSSWSIEGSVDQVSIQQINAQLDPVLTDHKIWRNGVVSFGDRTTYTYTPSGRQREIINSVWSDGQLQLDDRYEFMYDNEDGRLLMMKHCIWDGGSWVLSTDTRAWENHMASVSWWTFGLRDDQSLSFWGFSELTFGYRNAVSDVGPSAGTLPHSSILSQNYPNPFNPTTTIPFAVSSGARTTLVVYDILGREVARPVDEWKDPGEYRVQFDAAALASGMYITRFTSGTVTQTNKMILMR
jgi:hypothetical protein